MMHPEMPGHLEGDKKLSNERSRNETEILYERGRDRNPFYGIRIHSDRYPES